MKINSMAAKAGITHHMADTDGVQCNIFDQGYTPKKIAEHTFSLHAMPPMERFIHPHIHPKQYEYTVLLDGK